MNILRLLVASLLCAPLLAASGCVIEPRRTLGDQCELNSECQAPLVCRLARCRNECLTTRDCGLGLRCVLAPDGLGVCQLPDETECGGDEDCPETLVCSPDDGCVNGCGSDDDCVAGAACRIFDAGRAMCIEPQVEGCLYTSDCAEPLVCREQRCALECAGDEDCDEDRFRDHCVAHPTCDDGPCVCRQRCLVEDPGTCFAPGTVCVPAADPTDDFDGICERIVLDGG